MHLLTITSKTPRDPSVLAYVFPVYISWSIMLAAQDKFIHSFIHSFIHNCIHLVTILSEDSRRTFEQPLMQHLQKNSALYSCYLLQAL